jgi:hypothetical protein
MHERIRNSETKTPLVTWKHGGCLNKSLANPFINRTITLHL